MKNKCTYVFVDKTTKSFCRIKSSSYDEAFNELKKILIEQKITIPEDLEFYIKNLIFLDEVYDENNNLDWKAKNFLFG